MTLNGYIYDIICSFSGRLSKIWSVPKLFAGGYQTEDGCRCWVPLFALPLTSYNEIGLVVGVGRTSCLMSHMEIAPIKCSFRCGHPIKGCQRPRAKIYWGILHWSLVYGILSPKGNTVNPCGQRLQPPIYLNLYWIAESFPLWTIQEETNVPHFTNNHFHCVPSILSIFYLWRFFRYLTGKLFILVKASVIVHETFYDASGCWMNWISFWTCFSLPIFSKALF